MRTPLPSTIAGLRHTWEAVRCSACTETIGGVVSFDGGRVPEDLLCTGCREWRLVKCTRCGRLLGSTLSAHEAPLLYCAACWSLDEEAAGRRERTAAATPRAALGLEEEQP